MSHEGSCVVGTRANAARSCAGHSDCKTWRVFRRRRRLIVMSAFVACSEPLTLSNASRSNGTAKGVVQHGFNAAANRFAVGHRREIASALRELFDQILKTFPSNTCIARSDDPPLPPRHVERTRGSTFGASTCSVRGVVFVGFEAARSSSQKSTLLIVNVYFNVHLMISRNLRRDDPQKIDSGVKSRIS